MAVAQENDNENIVFSNSNSGNSALYINTSENLNAWSAIILPEDSTYEDKSITLSKSLEESVYYIFSANAPDSDKLTEFIDETRKYLDANYRVNFSNNLTIAWLLDINNSPDKDNVIAIDFYPKSGLLRVSQTFNYTLGNDFATLSIDNNTVVNLLPDNGGNLFQFVYNSNSPNISFSSKEYGSDTLLNQNLTISFTEYSLGAFGFPLGFNLASDFKAFFLQTSYRFTDPDEGIETFTYPIFAEQADNLYAMTLANIDPLDIGNSQGLNTYFAFTGKTYNNTKSTESATCLISNYAINTGYPINLFPKVDLVENSNPENNQIPSDTSGILVISPQDLAETERFYLQPQGDYYLDSNENSKDTDGLFDFLPGLSGTETITFSPYTNNTGDTLRFLSKQPAYAANYPSQETSLVNPGSIKPTLSDEYLTSWANIISGSTDNIQYVAQPDGASLFAKDHGVSELVSSDSNLLGFFEPSIEMPQDDFYVPITPYLDVQSHPQMPYNENLQDFETQVLSKKRKSLITERDTVSNASKSARKRTAMVNSTDSNYTASATPQGLLAHVNNTGSWSLLNLGQNTITSGASSEYVYPENEDPTNPSQYQLSFINLSSTLQNAFLTNQQFLVVTQNNYLGELFSDGKTAGGSSSSSAIFNNKMAIEDWPFDINVGTSNTYADYNNVVIFKFCAGTLIDYVKNPNIWTEANTFNTDGETNPDNAYQQLVAISSWLQAYLQEAEDAYQYGLDNPESNQAILYEKFHTIINDPNWNGILVLKTDIDLREFPQQLKGLICGIDLNNFYGHHLGIEVNKINSDGSLEMEKNSSIFGLINYLDPVYSSQVSQGQNANKPIPPAAGATYDFKVLQLQVLFENTAIKFFQSKVQLTMNNLFSDKVISCNNPYGAGDLNSIVLNGTYQDHDGTPVYIFENTNDNLFYFDSNLLQNVEITKIQFNTLTTDPAAIQIDSQFAMWGYLNYAVMQTTTLNTDDVAKTTTLDAYSFGNISDSNEDVTDGLSYNNLYINMSFSLNTPSVVDYAFDASKIVFNSNLSSARTLSLYPNFALQINNLIIGDDDTPPSSLGYLTLSIPGIKTEGLSGDWYGLEMTLNMGSPGELASSLDFNANLLIAWSPGKESGNNAYNSLIGIKLPGTSSNAKLLSLQGVLKLSIDTLKLEYVEDQKSYLMTLSKIALTFLGILKLPPGGNTNFLLFGNPNEGATAKSLGWYAAYNKTKS